VRRTATTAGKGEGKHNVRAAQPHPSADRDETNGRIGDTSFEDVATMALLVNPNGAAFLVEGART